MWVTTRHLCICNCQTVLQCTGMEHLYITNGSPTTKKAPSCEEGAHRYEPTSSRRFTQ